MPLLDRDGLLCSSPFHFSIHICVFFLCSPRFVLTVFWRFIFQRCLRHAGRNGIQHYQAVCRALATEALELTQFLAKVKNGGAKELYRKADAVPCQELDNLRFADWVIILFLIVCVWLCPRVSKNIIHVLRLYTERFSWSLSRRVIFEPRSNYYR